MNDAEVEPKLEIQTLGGLSIRLDGQPVSGFASRKVEALLVYLAANPRPHPREVLADLFWDELPQRRALTNLRVALSSLRKQLGPHLSITRDSVVLNFDIPFWLDLAELEEHLAVFLELEGVQSSVVAERLEPALELYQGEFLEGFFVKKARRFEEWVVLERERLHHLVLDALRDTVAFDLKTGNYKRGIAHARRLLQLDPLTESAHRQLMRLLAASGQRAAALAQYESCRRIMVDELGVEPEERTRILHERIKSGEVPASTRRPETTTKPHLPAFFEKDVRKLIDVTPFVAREPELEKLNGILDRALDGQGQIAFIVGEAGQGKSALLSEFVRIAHQAHPELVAVGGSCSAFTGVGDPYQPFREALEMLSGDLEQKWRSGLLPQDQALRLWNLLPTTTYTLCELGRNLVNGFISGKKLLTRIANAVPGDPGWLEDLRARVGQDPFAGNSFEQHNIHQQFTDVLQTLAEKQLLIITLDDLQWIDSASTALLFYLAQRVAGSRILILGAYRPEMLVEDEQHALGRLINEIRQTHDDIFIDLRKVSVRESQQLVEELLDTEPNQLSRSFCQALFQRTGGHPLFTIELLRDLQERGDLLQDAEGKWVEGHQLNWDVLPTRVESVIKQRIDRLESELRELLRIASVEGENFTAQVIARLQKIGERQLLQHLSGQLEKHHQLVHELGESKISGNYLQHYRFSHALIQQFMYNGLSSGQRRLLHAEIAQILEALYAGQEEEISVQLARHYSEAGVELKAIHYLIKAGDAARELFAYQEAIGSYEDALSLLRGQDDYDLAARTLMKLGLTHHLQFDYPKARETFNEGFDFWQKATRMPKSEPLHPAPHAYRRNFHSFNTVDPALTNWTHDTKLVGQLFSGLVEMRPSLEIVPDLANSWEVLEEGRKYMITIRDDARWSDGKPLTADDFEFAWKRVLDPVSKSPNAELLFVLKNAKRYFQGLITDHSQVGVRAIDHLTLEIDLERPIAYFLTLLAYPCYFPVPRHAVRKHGISWTDPGNFVGNGPYRLERWIKGKSMTLIRNQNYLGLYAGNVHRIELMQNFNEQDELRLFEAGELDTFHPFLSEDIQSIIQRNAGDFLSSPTFVTWYVCFNVERPPMNDKRVRQAFALSVDLEALSKRGLLARHNPAQGGLIPFGMPGHSADIGYPYQPQKGRALLRETGYRSEDSRQEFELLSPMPSSHELGKLIVSHWQKNLNAHIKWIEVESDEYSNYLKSRPPHLVFSGWAVNYPDPDDIFRINPISKITNWHSNEFIALTDKASMLSDQEERLLLYQKADKLLINEAVVIPLSYGRHATLLKPWVKNYPFSPMQRDYWKDIIIEEHD